MTFEKIKLLITKENLLIFIKKILVVFSALLFLVYLISLIVLLHHISLETPDPSVIIGKLSFFTGLTFFITSFVYSLFKHDKSSNEVIFIMSIWIFGSLFIIYLINILTDQNKLQTSFLDHILLNASILTTLLCILYFTGIADSQEDLKAVFQILEKRFSFAGAIIVVLISLIVYMGEGLSERIINNALSLDTFVSILIFILALLIALGIISLFVSISNKIEREETINLINKIETSLKPLNILTKDFYKIISKSIGIILIFIIAIILFLFFDAFNKQNPSYILFGVLAIIISLSIAVLGYVFEEKKK